jgi:hypothetical protein
LLGDDHQLVMVVYEGFGWAYLDGELYIDALPLTASDGEFYVKARLADPDAECEITDLWAYAE